MSGNENLEQVGFVRKGAQKLGYGAARKTMCGFF